MTLPSVSLKTQLLCAIVGSIVATAVTLTTLAYRAQVVNLEREARRAAHVAAQSRAEAVARLVDGQQQRAQRFLVSAASLCGETTPSGRIAWELGCAQRALREFRTSERAAGAVLTSRRGRVARTGVAVADAVPVPSPLARLVERAGRVEYLILAENFDSAIRLQFTLLEISALFDQPVGLGASGEVFLHDSAGMLLTPPRYAAPAGSSALTESSQPCVFGAFEREDIDYRGVATIHGLRPVAVFARPLCVDAHMSRDEALVPAAVLLLDLVTRAGLLSLVGVVLALIGSYWMSAPVQRLAVSARALQGGDFGQPIPTGGPSEVRALADAFRAMARELSAQMARAERARQDAENANHAKDEFLAVLSHELRTPLTSTLGWTRLLRRKGLDADHTDRAIAAIERSAQLQKRLIEDLLDVSSIIARRLQLDRTVVDVSDAVRVVLEQLRPAAEAKGVQLDTRFQGPPTIIADALRLQQIVTNLVANAIKFTGSGGRVTVVAYGVEGGVDIEVADTGIGIAPEFLPHIFEPFRQADVGPRRAYGGLGLGLSIVHHLIELHGGTIEATSRGLGCGTTFKVRLPLVSHDDGTLPQTHGIAQPSVEPIATERPPVPPRLDSLRVLVVDDDDQTRHVVAALLHDAGATVDDVASAAEARQRIQTHHYSAIVSDLAMPQEDGYTFMRTLRSTSEAMPALALSGRTRREDVAAAYAAGFQMCLTKPIDRDKLIIAIADLTLRKIV